MQLILLKITITLMIAKNDLYFLRDVLEIKKSETKRKGGMKKHYLNTNHLCSSRWSGLAIGDKGRGVQIWVTESVNQICKLNQISSLVKK